MMPNEVINNLEQQIDWIENIQAHQFPGWGHTVGAMRQALALLKAQEPTDGDTISRSALLAAYDAAHKGPPGGARKLIVEAPAVTLKAQGPRVMTMEEILSSDGAVWILDHDDKGCEIHIAFPLRKRGELDPVIEFRSRASDMREHRLIRDYLINWCCWTSRPSDEQRKAVKWND